MKSQCDIINRVSRMITGIMTSKCDPINFLFRTAALFCHCMCRVTENGQKSDNSISIDLYHKLKGILPKKVFYCLNLIFWIAMGCGYCSFWSKGPKNHLNLKILHGLHGAAQGFRGAALFLNCQLRIIHIVDVGRRQEN